MIFGKLIKRFKTGANNDNGHAPDKSLISAIFLLLIIGLIVLFSASSVISYQKFGVTYHYAGRQLAYILVSLVIFFIATKINYLWWKKFASFLLFSSIILLVLVFIPGLKSDYGTAHSWINILGVSLQPAELVKIAFLIYLATWMEAKKSLIGSFRGGVFPFIIILTVISLLMLAQPDMGTLFIIIASAMAAFFIGGGKMTHIIITGLLGILLLFLVVNMGSSYQSDRFACLKDPSSDPKDKCFQINQSLIAVGSGGLWGRGLGESRQKFMYLPEVWGDAIFPVIAEELGFVFSTLLILLYLFIFYRGLLIAKKAPDLYSATLATGIVAWLAVQTFLNVSGMINLIPMTGVPLPLISAGGSSVLSSLIALGILVNISKHTKEYGQRRIEQN